MLVSLFAWKSLFCTPNKRNNRWPKRIGTPHTIGIGAVAPTTRIRRQRSICSEINGRIVLSRLFYFVRGISVVEQQNRTCGSNNPTIKNVHASPIKFFGKVNWIHKRKKYFGYLRYLEVDTVAGLIHELNASTFLHLIVSNSNSVQLCYVFFVQNERNCLYAAGSTNIQHFN